MQPPQPIDEPVTIIDDDDDEPPKAEEEEQRKNSSRVESTPVEEVNFMDIPQIPLPDPSIEQTMPQ